MDNDASWWDQLLVIIWSPMWAPQPIFDASDQNIRSGGTEFRDRPCCRRWLFLHQLKSSSISSSQEMIVFCDWQSHCWQRASCIDRQLTLPLGMSSVNDAKWPSNCCYRRASWGFCNLKLVRRPCNLSLLYYVRKALKVVESNWIPRKVTNLDGFRCNFIRLTAMRRSWQKLVLSPLQKAGYVWCR